MDERGRVLLLKHRFWKDQRWGLPGGLARYGETLAETLRRELQEEAGIEVAAEKLLQVNTTPGRLMEFILLAKTSGLPTAKSPEIMDARFWDLTDLPENLQPGHRKLLGEFPALLEGGMPLEK